MLPKSGSATSRVEHENKGDSMATNGLRTERVTLEVTHDLDARLSDWIVEVIDESLGLMESVRVVDEDRILAASKKLIEVDQEAALRGFDTTTFQRLWISAIARVLGLELARPPRSKCDNPGDGSIPSPGILASPALVEAHQQIAALTAERDAAIRERNSLREQLESVACRAATAETALEAASGGEGEAVASTLTTSQDQVLEALSAETTQPGGCHHFLTNTDKAIIADIRKKLTPAPPQPRGWLKEEEREAVEYFSQFCDEHIVPQEWNSMAGKLRTILARSTPPEVIRPKVNRAAARVCVDIVEDRDAQWLAANAAAGVAVKEVPRE